MCLRNALLTHTTEDNEQPDTATTRTQGSDMKGLAQDAFGGDIEGGGLSSCCIEPVDNLLTVMVLIV